MPTQLRRSSLSATGCERVEQLCDQATWSTSCGASRKRKTNKAAVTPLSRLPLGNVWCTVPNTKIRPIRSPPETFPVQSVRRPAKLSQTIFTWLLDSRQRFLLRVHHIWISFGTHVQCICPTSCCPQPKPSSLRPHFLGSPQQTLNCGPHAFVVHVAVLSCHGWWKSAQRVVQSRAGALQQDQPCTL